MANTPEVPIEVKDPILVIDYKEAHPRLAVVTAVEDDNSWQIASLLSVRSLDYNFRMSTRIRIATGVYCNRSDRYRFLRLGIATPDTVQKHLEYIGNGNVEKVVIEVLRDMCKMYPEEMAIEMYTTQSRQLFNGYSLGDLKLSREHHDELF